MTPEGPSYSEVKFHLNRVFFPVSHRKFYTYALGSEKTMLLNFFLKFQSFTVSEVSKNQPLVPNLISIVTLCPISTSTMPFTKPPVHCTDTTLHITSWKIRTVERTIETSFGIPNFKI
ncbi:hypothetical protein TNCT_379741 [Trichonephila clavata]|uniref:Uncharacterized protein n=1 Tax=Trichonephila clavata TaxID=2740835 RepID=A0A8X6HC48_TRICU|nr:hypothetical protein TNCT_379741 [Trichonephila clavata]